MQYTIVNTLSKFQNAEILALDFETFGVENWDEKAMKVDMFSIAAEIGDKTYACVLGPDQLQNLYDLIKGKRIVFHNFKFDGKVIHRNGGDVFSFNHEDTLLMASILDEESHHDLKTRSRLDLGFVLTEWGQVNKKDRKAYTKYAAEDAVATLHLFKLYRQRIIDEDLVLAYTIEKKANLPIMFMEYNGVGFNPTKADSLKKFCKDEMNQAEDFIFRDAQRIFGLDSVGPLAEYIYKDLKIPLKKNYLTEKTNRPSTSLKVIEDVLNDLDEDDDRRDRIFHIVNYKKLKKLYTSFFGGVVDNAKNSWDGRVHPGINNSSIVTGRLCVAGDTILETSMGEVEISKLDLNKWQGVTILTHKGNQKSILRKFYKGIEEMFEVILENGSSIKCTANHRFLTPFGWRKLNEIIEGSEVCIPYGTNKREKYFVRGGFLPCIFGRKANYKDSDGKIPHSSSCSHVVETTLLPQIFERVKRKFSFNFIKTKIWEQVRGERVPLYNCFKTKVDKIFRFGVKDSYDSKEVSNERIYNSQEYRVPQDKIENKQISSKKFPAYGYRFSRKTRISLPGHIKIGKGIWKQAKRVFRESLFSPLRNFTASLVCATSFESTFVLQGSGNSGKISHLLEYKQGRTTTFFSFARSQYTPYSVLSAIQKLYGGFLYPLFEFICRGGWRIPSTDGYEKKRQIQNTINQKERFETIARNQKRSGEEHENCFAKNTERVIKIIPIGLQEVWDIEVEEDHSYCAQGFINHNSMSNPNLQQLPADPIVKDDMDTHIRSMFVPDEGNCLVSSDYSQIELRIMVHLCQQPEMVKAYKTGVDYHEMTSKMCGGIDRKKAKIANFLMLYGGSPWAFARAGKVSVDFAKKYYRDYARQFPYVGKMKQNVLANVLERGYIRTIGGRKRRLNPKWDWDDEGIIRAFTSALIQGGAAIVMKLGMAKAFDRLKGTDTKLILSIHDELLFETPIENKENVKQVIKEEMENCIELKVPLLAEPKDGMNFAECK